jgi:hypothetical protein
MPAGLSLAPATGIISGTPTASGTFSLGITLSDSSQPVQQVLSVVTITVTGAPLSILTTSLQPANLHMPYLAQLQASGGTPPAYTWAITSGSLPLGFLLAPTTGQIYGRPAVTGTFSFGVTVTDSGNPAQSKSGVVTVVVPSGCCCASCHCCFRACSGNCRLRLLADLASHRRDARLHMVDRLWQPACRHHTVGRNRRTLRHADGKRNIQLYRSRSGQWSHGPDAVRPHESCHRSSAAEDYDGDIAVRDGRNSLHTIAAGNRRHAEL